MQTQILQPFRVVYDVQKNKYYKVNKLTGQISPSYKTGKTYAKFNPNITGTDYLARSKAFHTIQPISIESYSMQSNQRTIEMALSKKSNNNINTGSINKDKINSRLSYSQKIQKDKSLQKNKQYTSTNVQRKSQAYKNNRNIKMKSQTKDEQNILLPRIKKQNSLSKINSNSLSTLHENVSINQSIHHTIRNSQSSVDNTYIYCKTKQNNKDNSFINCINKLNLSSGDHSISQSRMQFDKFDNKLRRYCQIQENKLTQNNFQPLQNNQKSLKLKKFSQKSLLISLDQSNFTIDHQSNINLSRLNNSLINNIKKQHKSITKKQIQQSLDKLSKQKASLLLLAKKCQQQRSLLYQKVKQSGKKLSQPNIQTINLQSQPNIQTINLQSIEQQQKLKNLIQKQKQTFLSFYPTYIFKQNPRLIKQQKDRKINLKKLEHLYLQNNQKKFGRIYRSQSKDKNQ